MVDFAQYKLQKGQSNWNVPINNLIDQIILYNAALQVQIDSNNAGLQTEIDNNKTILQAQIDGINIALQAQIDNNAALINSINVFLEQNSTFSANIDYFDFAKASRLIKDTIFGINIF